MASNVQSATVGSAILILAVQLICCSLHTGAFSPPLGSCPAGYMNCGYNHKNRCLTYVNTDVNNCGNCGVKCSTPPHSTRTCYNCKCGFTCNKGWKDCDRMKLNGCETCVQGDIKNCGDCGKKCPLYAHTTAPKCANGICTGNCQKGWKDCNNNLSLDGCEAQLKCDKNNCGACGVLCAPAANADGVCYNSKCGIQCYKGFADCDRRLGNGCEAALQSDVFNCGACAKKCACPPNSLPTCASGNCGFTCKPGFSDCNLKASDGCEVTLASDIFNCGACGAACSIPNAQPLCSNGTCDLKSCNEGFNDCNGLLADGCEFTDASLQIDPLNCGSCGNKCDCPPNANATCVAGSCGYTCRDGFKDCNRDAEDGCEIAFQTDPLNCGDCGIKCDCPPNANATCVAGSCGYTCKDGFKDCNRDAEDGCEIAFQTDPLNCGDCGIKCDCPPNANATCVAGSCGYTCKDGFKDCNRDAKDGCEIAFQTDPLNCGDCGIKCDCPPNANATCVAGSCGYTCRDGFKDCNRDAEDGCEIAFQTDPLNCGDCGIKCDCPPNANATCIAGSCGYTCKDGFKDCNRDAEDGCEIAFQTDPLNCGDCGIKCDCPPNANATCVAGSCGYTCKDGFKDCNRDAKDGCEIAFQTDPLNCGDCGIKCDCPPNAVPTCAGGKCGFTCKDGFKDCNGDPKDGCEVKITNDIYNCGACNNSCKDSYNGFHVCVAGKCCPCGSDQECAAASPLLQNCIAGWCTLKSTLQNL